MPKPCYSQLIELFVQPFHSGILEVLNGFQSNLILTFFVVAHAHKHIHVAIKRSLSDQSHIRISVNF